MTRERAQDIVGAIRRSTLKWKGNIDVFFLPGEKAAVEAFRRSLATPITTHQALLRMAAGHHEKKVAA